MAAERGGKDGRKGNPVPKRNVLIPLIVICSIYLISMFNLQNGIDEKCIAYVADEKKRFSITFFQKDRAVGIETYV
jgi:hypothetical protein